MAKFVREDGTEYDVDIERLKHEHMLAQIEARNKADLILEDRKFEHSVSLEQQRRETNLAVENRKGMWTLGIAVGGVIIGTIFKLWADSRGVSERTINDGAGMWKKLR